MFLIGCTKTFKDLGWYLRKLLELDKEKVILVEIEPETDGGDKDIFEVIHYDDQGVSYTYSKQEIAQMILRIYEVLLAQLLAQLPN